MNSSELVKIEETVRRIGRALSDGEDPKELYSLATQYKDYCAVANNRLASCVEMLSHGKGKEYAALMHATRSPDILELVAVLSDPDLTDWREYCKQNRLPVPDPLNEHAKQKLDPIYSRVGSFNDQLYGEYTAAQTRRDFEEALRIIRQISHLNPSDQGAVAQVATLAKRLRKKELEELDKAMRDNDQSRVIKLLDRIEEISPGYEEETTLWARAMDTLGAVRREEADVRAKSLLAEAEDEYGQKNLDSVLRLTAELSAIVEEHDLDLGTASQELLEEMSGWSSKMLQQLREDDRFDRAVLALEEVVELVRQKEFRATASKLPELRKDKARLEKAWHDMAQFRRGISADLKDAAEKSNGDLDRKISQIEGTRSRSLIGAIALALLLTVSASVYTILRVKANDSAKGLKEMVMNRQVIDLEERLGELESEKPWTLKFPILSEEVLRSQTWLRQEKGKAPQLDESVAALEQTIEELKEGWDEAKAKAFQDQLARVRQNITEVAEDLQGELSGRIDQVTNAWGVLVEEQRVVLAEAFRKGLDALKKRIDEELDFSRPPGEVAGVVVEIQPEIGELERLSDAPDIPELKLTGADITRFGVFKDQVALFEAEIDLIEEITLKSVEAPSLESYFIAIEKFDQSKFLRGERKQEWKNLRSKIGSKDDFLKAVLIPDDLIRWNQFSASPKLDRHHPAALFPTEQTAFLELRDNSDLRDIYRYSYKSAENPGKLPLYVRTSVLTQTESRLGAIKTITIQGREVYRPWLNRTFASFKPVAFKAQFSGNSQSASLPTDQIVSSESAFFNQLALNQYVGENLDVYGDSLLKAVDHLIESPEINPLFRAYVHSQLYNLMALQVNEWALSWTSFDEDYERLKGLMKTPLTSSSWMVPIQNETLSGPLSEYYQSLAGVSYYQQAVVVSRFFSTAFDNSFSYAGFVDYRGNRQSTPTVVLGNDLWGFDSDLNPRVIFHRAEEDSPWENVAQAHFFTPLFETKTDGRKLLEDICRQNNADPNQEWIRKKIPSVLLEKHE